MVVPETMLSPSGAARGGRGDVRVRVVVVATTLSLLCALCGCNPKRSGTTHAAASTSASAESSVPAGSAPTKTASTATPVPTTRLKPPVFHIPVGPAFGVEPGVGMGPIRFGATVATVERLMDQPCVERTKDACYYPNHALDFLFEDGVLARIHIHGEERPFKNDGSGYTYGIFNGKLLNGVELGMYREYVEQLMGPPPKGHDVKLGTAPRGFQTVYVGEYPGITMEYDKLKNGNVVLAGMALTKASPAALAATPKPTARPRPKPPLH
jgi:hypothetical protein